MSTPGRVFGGRYAVLGHAGAGGMAEVYRARDELLGREVALKVLSDRFSKDHAFVERFRREAQSAANLNHPNIVSLFDFGSDDGTYFIVMEFIDGSALSDLVARGGPLLPERAAEIAADVAGALDRAHRSSLVHRDIKPSNIMVNSSGQTKVTDFGIARALSADGQATMTQTGMVIGTAAYLSPEQAQGNPVDQRSDIYSLGCVLYEMLAGQPPFTGETPLAIAYKHVRENPQPPSSVNPDVPSALDAVVMKAMAKNPDNRYSTAGEMREDLQRFLAGQRVEATPLLASDTMVERPGAGTQVLTTTSYDDYGEPPPERRRGWLYVLITLLLLALVAGLAWLLWNAFVNDEEAAPVEVEVPNLVGSNVDDARDELEELGLDSAVERRNSRKPRDEVIDQEPAPQTTLTEGDTVTLVVSNGPRQVEVPEVVGQPQDEAEQILADANLDVGDVTEEPSEDFEPGIVLSQAPLPGDEVDAGSAVDLVVSSGPEPVEVPNVIGQSEDEAEATLQAAGFDVDVGTEPSEETEDTVIAQSPAGGTLAEPGSTVFITVSEGPEEQPMPDVTGDDADAAEAELEAMGLVVTRVDETEPCTLPPGTVCRQDPAPGEGVKEGDSATIYVQP